MCEIAIRLNLFTCVLCRMCTFSFKKLVLVIGVCHILINQLIANAEVTNVAKIQ